VPSVEEADEEDVYQDVDVDDDKEIQNLIFKLIQKVNENKNKTTLSISVKNKNFEMNWNNSLSSPLRKVSYPPNKKRNRHSCRSDPDNNMDNNTNNYIDSITLTPEDTTTSLESYPTSTTTFTTTPTFTRARRRRQENERRRSLDEYSSSSIYQYLV